MPYSYKVAEKVLSEADKNRLLAVYLALKPDGKPDWDIATAEFGAASANSMRVMTNSALKKIKEAGGLLDGNEASTPASSCKKRKGTVVDGDDAEVTPTAKKCRQKGKTKELSPLPKDDDDDDDEIKIEL